MNFRPGGFQLLPPAVKNLLIINGLFFLATIALASQNIDLIRLLGLYYLDSPQFKPYQIFTHIFMHGGFLHIFMNMYALWLFGSALENVWGPKKFLIYYFITGLGAIALHLAVNAYTVNKITGGITIDLNEIVINNPKDFQTIRSIYFGPVVGASGAVFGVLLAFGMMFPNTQLMLLFPPIPIRAKYFVIIYGLLELYLGIQQMEGDNVAHFAHLGGMLFGFIMIKIWSNNHHGRSRF